MSRGNLIGAREDFEKALDEGYRAAAVDLARLLVRERSADPKRVLSLLNRAWQQGVLVAAYDLGELYEEGLRPQKGFGYALAPDPARAALWYGRGARAREPNALAHRAELEEVAASDGTQPLSVQQAHWLAAFRFYAAAAERARREDWPDATWRNWRYLRASLARRLAREGLMDEVAANFGEIQSTD